MIPTPAPRHTQPQSLTTIGVVGQGSFGRFAARVLAARARVAVCDRDSDDRAWARVARCQYVVLAVPLEAYGAVTRRLGPLLAEGSVVVDVCSVKQQPLARLRAALPGRPLVATHPLFGPESAANGVAGHTLVLCPEVSDAAAARRVEGWARRQGLRVVRMSAEQHDRDMALVQGLTFFVAHGLAQLGVEGTVLSTPSFAKLRALADLDRHHSAQLLATIQAGNPHTPAVRQALLQTLTRLDADYRRDH